MYKVTCILSFFFQSDPSTSFLRAARAGQLEKVLEYLESGVDINASNAVSHRSIADISLDNTQPCIISVSRRITL